MSEAALRSERLAYRLFRAADADYLLALMHSPGWLRYIGDRGVRTAADAEDYIANKFVVPAGSPWAGNYLVSKLEDGARVGLVGIYHREELDLPDVGYAILPEFYRKGYATEATAWLLARARAAGEVATAAICNHDAYASQGLLRKLGFAYVQEVKVAHSELPEQYWVLAL